MGCRILYDAENDVACLYDSVTETAFGGLFRKSPDGDAQAVAEAFCGWLLPRDARTLDLDELSEVRAKFAAEAETRLGLRCDDCGDPLPGEYVKREEMTSRYMVYRAATYCLECAGTLNDGDEIEGEPCT